MVIFEKRKLIFFKSFKTAGTAIESELREFLQDEDVQVSFGYDDEYKSGWGEDKLKIGPKNILCSFRNPVLLLNVIKRKFLGEILINEHIDPETLILFFPEYKHYNKVTVFRDPEEINHSNYRMYKRRYGYSGSYEEFINDAGEIKNDRFYRKRISGDQHENITILNYHKKHEIISFFGTHGIQIKMEKRVN